MYMLNIIGVWQNEAKKAKPCPKKRFTFPDLQVRKLKGQCYIVSSSPENIRIDQYKFSFFHKGSKHCVIKASCVQIKQCISFKI